jgi:hypothetical protein
VLVPEGREPEKVSRAFDTVKRASAHADRVVFLTGGVFTTAAKSFFARVPNPGSRNPSTSLR